MAGQQPRQIGIREPPAPDPRFECLADLLELAVLQIRRIARSTRLLRCRTLGRARADAGTRKTE